MNRCAIMLQRQSNMSPNHGLRHLSQNSQERGMNNCLRSAQNLHFLIPTGLTRLVLTNANKNLITIEGNFLWDCTSLTSFDSSGLVSLENLEPESFLHLCANLNFFSSSGLRANVILELSSKGSNFIKEAIRRELMARPAPTPRLA